MILHPFLVWLPCYVINPLRLSHFPLGRSQEEAAHSSAPASQEKKAPSLIFTIEADVKAAEQDSMRAPRVPRRVGGHKKWMARDNIEEHLADEKLRIVANKYQPEGGVDIKRVGAAGAFPSF